MKTIYISKWFGDFLSVMLFYYHYYILNVFFACGLWKITENKFLKSKSKISARLFLQTTISLVDILSSINMFKKVFRLSI